MQPTTRKLLDRAFSTVGLFAIALMIAALAAILVPIFRQGVGAICFRGTVEHRKQMHTLFGRGDDDALQRDIAKAEAARQPVYDMLASYKKLPASQRRATAGAYRDLEKALRALLGPLPGDAPRLMPREQFGQARWDRAKVKLNELLYVKTWDYSTAGALGVEKFIPRKEKLAGTPLYDVPDYVAQNMPAMLRPRLTCYWRFLTDKAVDIHFFGGIGPELLGTLYLALGAMLFAAPLGIAAAVYFTEYARQGRVVNLLRSCVGTLAGVPSIVFGLFGLAFFINTLRVSPSKSVIAGSLTLGLLILPTVIRTAEEAIMAVPHTYKEAALSLGAGRWHTILTVILPAALPGILTGVVIALGRAAGETAPIIFTAAVSVGLALKPWEVLTNPTPALSWNIYNLATEHEAADEIRHVQFGMVMALIGLVLLLNLTAIFVRARIAARMKG
ncbi:MAG: phosphate ABC transporter permease PstA [Kiritimatiellia bacterium]|jgi:phosphate transport system permease protein